MPERQSGVETVVWRGSVLPSVNARPEDWCLVVEISTAGLLVPTPPPSTGTSGSQRKEFAPPSSGREGRTDPAKV